MGISPECDICLAGLESSRYAAGAALLADGFL